MSQPLTDDAPRFGIDLKRTPCIHVYGTETGGILEVRYMKPPSGEVQSTSAGSRTDVETEPEIPREKYVAREWRCKELYSDYLGLSIVVFGDGNVIGDYSSSSVRKT